MGMKKKKQEFILSDEALETHLNFLKEKDPSIIGKTCQMLSALKINMNQQEGLKYLVGVIEDMKRKGTFIYKEEKQHELLVKSIDEYLPEILKEKEWIDLIEKYVKDKFINWLTVQKRREEREIPYYLGDKEQGTDENSRDNNYPLDENPQVKPHIDSDIHRDNAEKIKNLADINMIFLKAGLTEREANVFFFKVATGYTEDFIAEILRVSRSTVKLDYKKAKNKLEKIRPYIT
jgi:DNA-directed RNA polymerase specialized sigma24 family protein